MADEQQLQQPALKRQKLDDILIPDQHNSNSRNSNSSAIAVNSIACVECDSICTAAANQHLPCLRAHLATQRTAEPDLTDVLNGVMGLLAHWPAAGAVHHQESDSNPRTLYRDCTGCLIELLSGKGQAATPYMLLAAELAQCYTCCELLRQKLKEVAAVTTDTSVDTVIWGEVACMALINGSGLAPAFALLAAAPDYALEHVKATLLITVAGHDPRCRLGCDSVR